MKKYKVAFIGTGARSVSYSSVYAKHPEIEVTAIADISDYRRAEWMEKNAFKNPVRQYRSYRELTEAETDLDGVVISLPNHLHRDAVMPFLDRGISVTLEKPMAITQEDCEAILLALKGGKAKLMMGYVLRSTPFYRKVHEILRSGMIGNVISMEIDELAGKIETRLILRGDWRRHSVTSGGSMMEKSSHDMDLLNWMTNSRPVALNCFGGSRIFRPNGVLPDRCGDCAQAENCLYRCDGECIYNADKDVADAQCVNLEFANGSIATFLLTFNCIGERAGRNIHVVGTRGRLWGNAEMNTLSYRVNGADKTENVDLGECGAGHYGGDEPHALQLLNMMRDPSYQPEHGAYAGYLSTVMCIAADRSMTEGRRIHFEYGADGFITLH